MRGFWHIVDAVLAAVIIIGFLTSVSRTFVITPEPESLNERVYDILQGLDDQGVLKGYAASMDASGLNSEIMFYSKNHTIEICDSAGTCTGTRPEASNVWAGSYITAGNNSYQPRLVRLYLW